MLHDLDTDGRKAEAKNGVGIFKVPWLDIGKGAPNSARAV